MQLISSATRLALDRAGITISALCAVHCVASIAIVAILGVSSELFLPHYLHEFGLMAAIAIAAIAIGWGAKRHRRMVPVLVATVGLGFMASALAMPHGPQESMLTIIGVGLVSWGHLLNMRAHRRESLAQRAVADLLAD